MVRCTLAPPPRLCCCCYSTTIKRWINKRKLDSFFSSQSASFPPSQSPSNFLSHTNSHSFSLCCPFSLSLSLSHSLGCPIFLRHSLSLSLSDAILLSISHTLSPCYLYLSDTISLFLQRCCPISFLWAARGRKYFEPSKEFDLRQERKSEKAKKNLSWNNSP